MDGNLFNNAIERVLSRLPDDVVEHFANSQSQFLQGLRSCIDNCVDGAVKDIDARVEGSRKRREPSSPHSDTGADAGVPVDEDDA
jgi:hypothetical protein